MSSSVLITGATGFLGKGLTRRFLLDNWSRICVYSRGEYAQSVMRKEFNDDQRLRWLIGDVRDKDRLERAMGGCSAVIHAAALKRIEVGITNPEEVTETNVRGTQNVIAAAHRARVQKVVFVSSDKAFEPISPYGQTKALAETLCFSANDNDPRGPRFAVCRYGNVWKSTGSLVPTWLAMRASGAEDVPITNPDCTRFFMRLSEAVDLVVGTLKEMVGGELNVPDLPAYRVGDLADAMGLKTRIVGLRPHEKLHESMCEGRRSDQARRMSVDELRAEL